MVHSIPLQWNKANDCDWFTISSDKTGTKWTGKCWYIHNLLRYEFDLQARPPHPPRPLSHKGDACFLMDAFQSPPSELIVNNPD